VQTQTDSTDAVSRLKEKLSGWEKRAKELMEKRKTIVGRSLTGSLDAEEKKIVEDVFKQVESLKEKELMDRDNTIKRVRSLLPLLHFREYLSNPLLFLIQLESKSKALEEKYQAEHRLKLDIEAKFVHFFSFLSFQILSFPPSLYRSSYP
jgi:hypothetical protein